MWAIQTTDVFDAWFDALDDADRTNVLAALMVLRDRGPRLSRPEVISKNSHTTLLVFLSVFGVMAA